MASSSLEKQVIELKDTIRLLNRTMESLQKSLDAALAREEEYLREKKNLQEQINYPLTSTGIPTKRSFHSKMERQKQ